MRKIILSSLFIVAFVCGLAESSSKKNDWSNVKKLKRETWIQVKTIDGRMVEGHLGDMVGDQILMIAGTTVVKFSKEEIHEIRKRKRGLASSILIGAGVGFVSGMLAGVALESGSGEDKGLLTALMAYSGSIVGATGTAIDGIDRWRLVYRRKEE